MKSIIVIRHAKSSWSHSRLADHDRPLNKRGEYDAPRMAEYLASTLYSPSDLVVSSAKRTQQTARLYQSQFNLESNHFHTEPELYHAGMQEWINVLERHWRLSDRPIAFFAHNPGVTNIVNWLCDEDLFNVPTCGMAVIGFPDSLERIDSGVGTLLDYQIPKKL